MNIIISIVWWIISVLPNLVSTQGEYILYTKYFYAAEEGGQLVQGAQKECFYCNQARVFNAKDEELKQIFYYQDGQQKYGYEVYLRDMDGRKMGSNYFDVDQHIRTYRYNYSAKGLLESSYAFDKSTGNLEYGTAFKYNSLGHLLVRMPMDENGKVTERYVKTLNEHGLPVKEEVVNVDGATTFRIQYAYEPADSKDWERQWTWYNGVLKEVRVQSKEQL